MKTKFLLFLLLFSALLAIGCRGLANVDLEGETITPSNVIVKEERSVSGYTGIDMRTFGKVILSQGENESLTIQGSDNIVPTIEATVRGGVLVIQTAKNINITGMNEDNLLTFTIVVKDLSSLTVSGAADIDMDVLSTSTLEVTMSGAGQFVLNHLEAETLNVTLSGLGSVEASGAVTNARIDIPGAGSVNAGDLQIQTADISISGFGGATIWVTDQLNGNISGGGNVRYYGDPQTDVETSGVGQFNSLGSK